MHTMDTFPLWMQYAYYGHFSILWTPLHYECNMHTMDTSPCILWTPCHYKCDMHTIDTSPYCGHLSIMNAICILWTPLHTVDTSPCILWTLFHNECNMHTMDTSPLWTQYAYYRHLCILQTHTMDTFAYKSLLHTLCINYGHPCIPRKPMHNMDPSASTDTSAYYSLHLCIHVPWTPMHNIDTSTYSRQLLPIVLLVHTTDTWVILVSVY